MSRTANIPYSDGKFIVPIVPLVQRINRALERMRPYRQLYYKHGEMQYYLRVLAPGHPEHLKEFGPMYGKYLIDLADHVNLWTVPERMMNPKVVRLKNGTILEQVALPPIWRFEVVTDLLFEARKALLALGAIVIMPNDPRHPNYVSPVTAPVTQPVSEVDRHTPECSFHHDTMDCDCGYWDSIIPDEAR